MKNSEIGMISSEIGMTRRILIRTVQKERSEVNKLQNRGSNQAKGRKQRDRLELYTTKYLASINV